MVVVKFGHSCTVVNMVVLDGLDDAQREAAEQVHGPVRVVAGAGTGKTRTVTTKIAHAVLSGQLSPKKILPLTHSQKAAGEMRDRLGRLQVGQVTARTFHAAALAQLKFFWERTDRPGDLVILDNRFALVRRALEKKFGKVTTEDVSDVSAEIGWAKTQLLLPSSYSNAAKAAGRTPNFEFDGIADVFNVYETLKNTSQRVDFEDLLGLLSNLIDADDFVQKHVRDTYQVFLVDEFQDVDPLQFKLLQSWVGGSEDVTIVGDPRQSIYSFRGADPKVFDRFDSWFPSALKVSLVNDYRSTPEVVSTACALLGTKKGELVGMRPPGPKPSVDSFPSEQDEESFIVSQLKKQKASGVPWSEMSILFRFNAQSARFESMLSSAGIPYIVADSNRFFDRPEVRAVLNEFVILTRESEPDAVGLDLLNEALNLVGFDRSNPPKGNGAARSRFDAQDALLTMVENFPSSHTLGYKYVLDELVHRSKESHEAPISGVTLSTLHKSKGLEWMVVFIPGFNEGAIPSMYATTPFLIEEEKRLAYVGLTRAKVSLFITQAQTNSKKWKQKPSRFLSLISPSTAKLAVTPPVRKKARNVRQYAKTNCASCSRALSDGLKFVGYCSACMPSGLAEAGERLTSWRLEVSRNLKVTPTDFMHDALLWKIAGLKPVKLSNLVSLEEFNKSAASGYGRDILKLFKGK